MTGRSWYEDRDGDADAERVGERAARAERFGWLAIAGVSGLLVVAVLTAVVLAVVAVVAGYLLITASRP
ncbi:hypothetical protein VM98_03675 [Streptomyces rubellomurinus subsp. indigoferus]|nr:hypothetical protein VM98_03675 [Streptomyces rubellomurinus subsp. indigoferus]